MIRTPAFKRPLPTLPRGMPAEPVQFAGYRGPVLKNLGTGSLVRVRTVWIKNAGRVVEIPKGIDAIPAQL